MKFDPPSQVMDQRQIITYLYKLSDQLSKAFINIDETNLSDEYRAKTDAVLTISEQASNLARLLEEKKLATSESVQTMYNTLRNAIFSAADSVISSFNSSLVQTQQSIMATVAANYVAEVPGQTFEERVQSEIDQSASSVNMRFDNVLSQITGVSSDIAELKSYITFNANGITIGNNQSNIILKLKNNRLSFVVGTYVKDGQTYDKEAAYIAASTEESQNKLHITSAEIEEAAFGNEAIGFFDAFTDDGGLFFNWRSV